MPHLPPDKVSALRAYLNEFDSSHQMPPRASSTTKTSVPNSHQPSQSPTDHPSVRGHVPASNRFKLRPPGPLPSQRAALSDQSQSPKLVTTQAQNPKPYASSALFGFSAESRARHAAILSNFEQSQSPHNTNSTRSNSALLTNRSTPINSLSVSRSFSNASETARSPKSPKSLMQRHNGTLQRSKQAQHHLSASSLISPAEAKKHHKTRSNATKSTNSSIAKLQTSVSEQTLHASNPSTERSFQTLNTTNNTFETVTTLHVSPKAPITDSDETSALTADKLKQLQTRTSVLSPTPQLQNIQNFQHLQLSPKSDAVDASSRQLSHQSRSSAIKSKMRLQRLQTLDRSRASNSPRSGTSEVSPYKPHASMKRVSKFLSKTAEIPVRERSNTMIISNNNIKTRYGNKASVTFDELPKQFSNSPAVTQKSDAPSAKSMLSMTSTNQTALSSAHKLDRFVSDTDAQMKASAELIKQTREAIAFQNIISMKMRFSHWCKFVKKEVAAGNKVFIANKFEYWRKRYKKFSKCQRKMLVRQWYRITVSCRLSQRHIIKNPTLARRTFMQIISVVRLARVHYGRKRANIICNQLFNRYYDVVLIVVFHSWRSQWTQKIMAAMKLVQILKESDETRLSKNFMAWFLCSKENILNRQQSFQIIGKKTLRNEKRKVFLYWFDLWVDNMNQRIALLHWASNTQRHFLKRWNRRAVALWTYEDKADAMYNDKIVKRSFYWWLNTYLRLRKEYHTQPAYQVFFPFTKSDDRSAAFSLSKINECQLISSVIRFNDVDAK